MADLLCPATGASVALGSRLSVGRVAGCGLFLNDRRVSSMHAFLWWSGDGWRVRDLGSRNGTWLDGRKLSTGEDVPIDGNSRLCFGAADAPEWRLSGELAPTARATEVHSGAVVEALDGLLALPPETPGALVYSDLLGTWVMEAHGQTLPAEDGQVVVLDGSAWRLSLPGPNGATSVAREGPSLLSGHLHFHISRDQEHVGVEIVSGGQTMVLERREHWWPIFVLAKERLADREAAPHDQGWLDSEQLEKKSGVDIHNLNTYIYRARRQLAAAGVEHAAQLVEVRRGQRRIGVPPERVRISDGTGR